MKEYIKAEVEVLCYRQNIFTEESTENDVVDDPYGESNKWWENN